MRRSAVLFLAIATFVLPRSVGAEIVRLTTGATLSVKSVAVDGDMMVLTLRGGGQMRAPRSLVAEVLPDEVLHADAASVFVLPALPPRSPILDKSDLRGMVDRLALHFGVQAELAHALITVESNYRPTAVSPKGAVGLMQLMPLIARAFAVKDPFDPEQNVSAGLQHLRGLLDRFDSTATALAAYNAGETAVARYGGIPPFRETQDYVRRILTLIRKH